MISWEGKRYDIKPLSIDRVLKIRNIFIGKSCRKCASEAGPGHLLILGNNPKQSLHARNYFRNKHLKRGLSKSLKKVNFNFSLKPSAFKWTKLQKTKET